MLPITVLSVFLFQFVTEKACYCNTFT